MKRKVLLFDTYHPNGALSMAQAQRVITALKHHLKQRGITYREVAQALAMSEASVKRMLGRGDLSLARLERIAELAHCNLSDLVHWAEERDRKITALSVEQEQEIAADLALLLISVSVISGFSFEELCSYYKLTEHTLIQKLAHLDRLKLIELLPGNRIRLCIAPNFHWQANGPIQQFFLERVARDFLASRFDKRTERLLVFNGLCSARTNLKIQERMQALINEASELMKQDRLLPLSQKHGNTLVLALRQWQFEAFTQLKRPGNGT